MQENKKIKMVGGLNLLKPDKRDFSHAKVFGTIEELPMHDFIVAEPIKIKNQFSSDLCTAFAGCAISEAQEGVELSPEWQFAKIKELEGDYKSWGANLRDAMKSMVKYGSIEQKHAPYILVDNPSSDELVSTKYGPKTEQNRDFIANKDNWPFELYINANTHKKQSYFKIDASGYIDLFNALRASLWQNKDKKREILTGCVWEKEWNNTNEGIIPYDKGTSLFGHAFAFIGQKNIGNELYLVAQLSNGGNFGDKGLFYFPRKVVNRKCTFGNYMAIDMSPEEARKSAWTKQQRAIEAIKRWIKQFIK